MFAFTGVVAKTSKAQYNFFNFPDRCREEVRDDEAALPRAWEPGWIFKGHVLGSIMLLTLTLSHKNLRPRTTHTNTPHATYSYTTHSQFSHPNKQPYTITRPNQQMEVWKSNSSVAFSINVSMLFVQLRLANFEDTTGHQIHLRCIAWLVTSATRLWHLKILHARATS